jgi:predicted TIM-barrel fold metal-dependent hydrolase
MMEAPAIEAVKAKQGQGSVVDCDIHNVPVAEADLRPFLSQGWWRHYERYGIRGYAGGYYPPSSPMYARRDAWPPSGSPPGSDYEFLREQLLDAFGVEYGVLNTLYEVGEVLNAEFGAALAHAFNQWQVEHWLNRDDRLRASLLMPYQDAELAVAEIERFASDARFVQALMVARTPEPVGRRRYWPIYAALEQLGLPLAMHFGGYGGSPVTAAGPASFYMEQHAGMVLAFQDQVTSLVCEGVFERYPGLKVVLVEGGIGWLPPLMWRLDHTWRKLRDEVPHLRRAPSEYVRDHFWLTTQPIDEPPCRDGFQHLLDQLDMDDRVMFATDYPHWDFDAPDRAIPSIVAPDVRRKIMRENALGLYRFEGRDG